MEAYLFLNIIARTNSWFVLYHSKRMGKRMGCLVESKVKLDYIQDFEMMFERMEFNRPREAAAYYATLVLDNPKEFSDFLRIAEDLANITRRPLEAGRNCLLKNGVIAEVLFSRTSENEEFGREKYLPIHPQVIWLETKDDLKEVISADTFSTVEHHLQEMADAYNTNFKTYGIKLQRDGNVTLRYIGKWVLYMMLSNCFEKDNHLRLQVGGEHLFEEPLIKYFRQFLELESNIELIIDTKTNIDAVKKLKEEYGDKLDVRYFSEEVPGTLRNYIFGKELAINGIKILSESNDEPSYVGTAYVNIDDVEVLNEKFDSLWQLAKPLPSR